MARIDGFQRPSSGTIHPWAGTNRLTCPSVRSNRLVLLLVSAILVAALLLSGGCAGGKQGTPAAGGSVGGSAGGPAGSVGGSAGGPAGSVGGSAGGSTVQFTDMAGRTVDIPKRINNVFCTSPIGTIMVYTLAPEKLAGWNSPLNLAEKKYIETRLHGLPVLGGWFGKSNTGNVEEILRVRPDIVISAGWIDHGSMSQADQIQNRLGIPVVMIDHDLKSLDKAYEVLGELLGEKAKAKELGSYCKETVSWVAAKTAAIPPDRRVRVYYAEGPEGLWTEPKGSAHVELLELCNAINVAECPLKEGYGRTEVSLEQVILWNPDIIIAGEPDFYAKVFDDPRWKQLRAVRERRVYLNPVGPFTWFDRPPSVNRVIGLWWVADILYHDQLKIDIAQKAKEFYAKFYRHNLTDQEIAELLKPKKGQDDR